MKKRKIAAAIAAMVMAFTAIPVFSVSALGTSLDLNTAISSSGVTPVKLGSEYYIVDDDIEKYMEIFADDEVAQLLTELTKNHSNPYFPFVGVAKTSTGHYTFCHITNKENCMQCLKDSDIWDKYDSILTHGGIIIPGYCEFNANEEILTIEEFEAMSYEEQIIYAVNYYNEHGEFLIKLGEAEVSAPLLPPDYGEAVQGDANLDGEMNFADAVCIMQHLANPAKYPITEQGIKNADMDGNGITLADALKIQRMVMGIE